MNGFWQVIETKLMPQPEKFGHRVSASRGNHQRIVIDFDWDLSIEENHKKAFEKFCEQYETLGKWHGGAIRGGYFVFVRVD